MNFGYILKEKPQDVLTSWKYNVKEIEDGLTNTLTNDSYFQDEINKIDNLPGQTKDEKRRAKLPVSAI